MKNIKANSMLRVISAGALFGMAAAVALIGTAAVATGGIGQLTNNMLLLRDAAGGTSVYLDGNNRQINVRDAAGNTTARLDGSTGAILLRALAMEGSCQNGMIGRTSDNVLVVCKSGTWKTNVATGTQCGAAMIRWDPYLATTAVPCQGYNVYDKCPTGFRSERIGGVDKNQKFGTIYFSCIAE